MLALFARLKQPGVFAGAVASSAPPNKARLRASNVFAQIVTDGYRQVDNRCPDLFARGNAAIAQLSTSASGRAQLASALQLCNVPQTTNDAMGLYNYAIAALETMIQYSYPYPTSFDNPVPAYPHRVTCQRAVAVGSPLGAIRVALGVYYNYTGLHISSFFSFLKSSNILKYFLFLFLFFFLKGQHPKCFNFGFHDAPHHFAGGGGPAPPNAWAYQTCSEVIQPMPTNGPPSDFYLPSQINLTALADNCFATFGVFPEIDWEPDHFSFMDLGRFATNVFLSNGELDPWHAGSFLTCPNTKCAHSVEFSGLMSGAAHHLDLRAPNSADPPSVVKVRKQELDAIHRWIKEWNEQ